MTSENYTIIIPARLDSSRLPRKVLLDLGGKPVLQHVYERACQSSARQVVIATENQEIESCAVDFGAKVIMTRNHDSGTARIAEAVRSLDLGEEEIVVNIQADEPLLPIVLMDGLAQCLKETQSCQMATVITAIHDEQDLCNPNVVKVVLNQLGEAIYFSRANIPYQRQDVMSKAVSKESFYRHIGLYAYRTGFLQQYVDWSVSPLEVVESLEQLRVLWYGEKIATMEYAGEIPHGIDVQGDLDKARILCEGR